MDKVASDYIAYAYSLKMIENTTNHFGLYLQCEIQTSIYPNLNYRYLYTPYTPTITSITLW